MRTPPRLLVICLVFLASGLAAVAAGTKTGKGIPDLYNYGDLDVKPVPTSQIAPLYPVELRAAGVRGAVVVEFVIDVEGNVIATGIVKASDKRLESLATDAVKQWKFTPPQKRGRAVNCRVSQRLDFDLAPPEEKATK